MMTITMIVFMSSVICFSLININNSKIFLISLLIITIFFSMKLFKELSSWFSILLLLTYCMGMLSIYIFMMSSGITIFEGNYKNISFFVIFMAYLISYQFFTFNKEIIDSDFIFIIFSNLSFHFTMFILLFFLVLMLLLLKLCNMNKMKSMRMFF